MGTLDDPFVPLESTSLADEFLDLQARERSAPSLGLMLGGVAVVGRLHGFDLEERPLIADVAQCPGRVLTGRSTVALQRAMLGSGVVLLFEGGEVDRPIIIGVMQDPAPADAPTQGAAAPVSVHADDERFVVTAEREIVLRCGEASITLTRAGKVIIKGNYILSRATGYNKIKGAAIDIN